MPSRANRLHHVGRRDQRVEVGPVFLLDLLDHFFAADEIRARRFGFLHLVAGGDHQNFFRLAQPVRQNHRAANHLVGVLGIDAQAHRDFYRLVELGELDFLEQRHRILQRVRTLSTAVRAFSIFFPAFLIAFSCLPPLIAVPMSRSIFDIKHCKRSR